MIKFTINLKLKKIKIIISVAPPSDKRIDLFCVKIFLIVHRSLKINTF